MQQYEVQSKQMKAAAGKMATPITQGA